MVLAAHASLPRLAQADGCGISSLARRGALPRDEVRVWEKRCGCQKAGLPGFCGEQKLCHVSGSTPPPEQGALREREAAGSGGEMA